jgi:hypothetical protein
LGKDIGVRCRLDALGETINNEIDLIVSSMVKEWTARLSRFIFRRRLESERGDSQRVLKRQCLLSDLKADGDRKRQRPAN